ncbi:MAG: alpha-L-fucosidase, partial [Anaerolineaceae bacterium]|nr:alpha-L-fucosidase [Anaerolineaceae bacterium]
MLNTYAPTPFGAIPSPRQLAWHLLEFYGFIHFTVNTFTNREWGLGNEAPAVFHPSDFSAEQIAETAASGGMKGLILTAKHHDGFCLWPSDFTGHSVKNSAWKDGKGDVVGDLARACQGQGIKFGVYLSPWDRNHPDYGKPEYVKHYRKQLRELLTRYGAFFEVWFDGANGGDGYYGGKYEKRTIDARIYYEWEDTITMIRELQPEAVIFGGMPGADVRWVGNEGGIAGDPCWHTFNAGMGEDAGIEVLNQGVRSGTVWFPAECDVSIRPGWFFHRSENQQVRDPNNLLDLYFKSVGRGASLLLNLPPDRRGQIHSRDVKSLNGLQQNLQRIFSVDLAKSARASSSNTRENCIDFAPG